MVGTLVLARDEYPKPGVVASFSWKNSGCSGPRVEVGETPAETTFIWGLWVHGLPFEKDNLRAKGSS